MKTWEVIKELTENPEKKFTHKSAIKGSYVTASGGGVVWRGIAQIGQDIRISLDKNDWEEVKEPLSFVEALKVLKDKPYECITLENQEYRIKFHGDYLDSILSELSAGWGSDEIADILLNSKFYIED